jgi:hypothetical protein
MYIIYWDSSREFFGRDSEGSWGVSCMKCKPELNTIYHSKVNTVKCEGKSEKALSVSADKNVLFHPLSCHMVFLNIKHKFGVRSSTMLCL